MAQQIVILGGGFGGLYAAKRLERRLRRQADVEVTLVSDANFMLFTPLLPGAAAGTLEPRHVVVSLRESLRRTNLISGSVTGLDHGARTVAVRTLDGRDIEIPFDHLVVALGSVSRTLPIPGLAEHGVGFKTLPDAIALRNRLLQTLEIAETIDDDVERSAWLTYVFVGAGYAGLEGLAELQDFAADVLEHYPRSRATGTRWLLVEAQPSVMPEIGPKLAGFAARELTRRGIEIRTGTMLEAVTETTVTLSGGEVVPARTLVWTAGVKPVAVTADLGLPLAAGGRLDVTADLRVSGHDRIWAIGDVAAVPDPARPGHPCPPTAQHAMRQAFRAADNLAAVIAGGEATPFTYKTRGVFVDMGQGRAVANAMGVQLRGIPAWWLARTYHLYLMPGIKRRWRLLVDWNVQLLFGRDVSELGALGRTVPLGDDPDAT
ncbi:MAG: NAD(P)/FAD-dependent oxidoreductase [Baekduia sp.]